jgi:hypothetical protein
MRILALLGLVLLSALSALAQGNGFPSGPHYTLNIQGKTNCAGSALTGSDRHTIQVLLNFQSDQNNLIDKTNKIFLQPGPAGSSPQVVDGNACDKGGALLQLPIDVSTTWSAYARALSNPNSAMNITSCQVDPGPDGTVGTLDDVINCSNGNPLDLVRKSGQPVTLNATSQLLFVCVGGTLPNCSGGTEVPIFSSPLFLYFWDVDNFGLRNAQIRFYPN